jgi:multidrug efflux system membrane fusion protein
VVLVPVPAVVEAEGGNYVYVVGADSTAATRPVKVGRSVGEYVVVTEGLEAGEVVVTDGQLRLVPGARVSIRRSQT